MSEDDFLASLSSITDTLTDTQSDDDLLACLAKESTTVTDTSSSTNVVNNRRGYVRYPFKWKLSMVFDDHQHRYRGVTHTISLDGASILSDLSIGSTAPVTLLIAIPPIQAHQSSTILEIKGRLLHSVLTSEHNCFKVGIKFIDFKRGSKQTLEDALYHRTGASSKSY